MFSKAVETGFQCWQLAEGAASNKRLIKKTNKWIRRTQNIRIP